MKETRKLKVQKELEGNIRKRFRLKHKNEAITDRILGDIKNLFEQEKDYYKVVRVGNFYSSNYME